MTATTRNDKTNTGKPARVKSGVPLLKSLSRELDLQPVELGERLGITARTTQRRLSDNTLSESEEIKLQMVARTFERATRVLGSEANARTWMESPIPALNQRTPLELLRDINGYERVRTILGRLASGTF